MRLEPFFDLYLFIRGAVHDPTEGCSVGSTELYSNPTERYSNPDENDIKPREIPLKLTAV
jgi:hypothetical protein